MAAQSLGLGSCWVQVRSRMFDDQTTSEQYVQNLLRIPEHIKVQCIIAVGYPDEHREPLAADDLKYWKVRANTYNKLHALGQPPIPEDRQAGGASETP